MDFSYKSGDLVKVVKQDNALYINVPDDVLNQIFTVSYSELDFVSGIPLYVLDSVDYYLALPGECLQPAV